MEVQARSGESDPGGVVALSGLVASGKSTLARALAQRLGSVRLEADAVRERLLEERMRGRRAPVAGASAPDPLLEGVRSFEAGFEERVYRALLDEAEERLDRERVVVLDAGFPTRRQRGAARALALRRGLPFLLVECRIDTRSAQRRIAARDESAGDRAWSELAARYAHHYEPVDELPEEEHLVIDATRPVAEAVEAVVERLHRRTRSVSQ